MITMAAGKPTPSQASERCTQACTQARPQAYPRQLILTDNSLPICKSVKKLSSPCTRFLVRPQLKGTSLATPASGPISHGFSTYQSKDVDINKWMDDYLKQGTLRAEHDEKYRLRLLT